MPSLNGNYPIRPLKTRFLEVTRLIQRIDASLKISELSEKSETIIYPPRSIFEWPNGTPIPKNLFVLVFADHPDKALDCTKIHSIIMLPREYPENKGHFKEIDFMQKQGFPVVKQFAICCIKFNTDSFEYMGNFDLDLLCLNDCDLARYREIQCYNGSRTWFRTKIFYIEPNKTFHRLFLNFFENLQELIICYPKMDTSVIYDELWFQLELVECSLLGKP